MEFTGLSDKELGKARCFETSTEPKLALAKSLLTKGTQQFLIRTLTFCIIKCKS